MSLAKCSSYYQSPRAYLHVMGMLRFVFNINHPILPTSFTLLLCLFLSYGPFTCISFHNSSWQLSAFSLWSPSLISALLVLSTIYLFLSRSGELRTQKLKSHLMRTLSLKVLPLKPGVGQHIAMRATLTARDFFLAYFYPSGSFTRIFFPKPLPSFSCVSCG